MVEYGISLSGTSGAAAGGGFSRWDMAYWADTIVSDPTYLLIAGAIFFLILVVAFAR